MLRKRQGLYYPLTKQFLSIDGLFTSQKTRRKFMHRQPHKRNPLQHDRQSYHLGVFCLSACSCDLEPEITIAIPIVSVLVRAGIGLSSLVLGGVGKSTTTQPGTVSSAATPVADSRLEEDSPSRRPGLPGSKGSRPGRHALIGLLGVQLHCTRHNTQRTRHKHNEHGPRPGPGPRPGRGPGLAFSGTLTAV